MSFDCKKTISLVGAGYWGKNLVRVFSQLGVLKSVCDLNDKILKERKKEYPNLEVTTNFSEILKDREIKGVVISTPAVTHYQLAKKVLEANKDVFIEKPLALNIKEGKELVNLARKKKHIIMVGHLLIYHPAIIKIKELIKKGDLGKIRYIWSNRLNFGKLRREESVLWSFAPHDISIIINILGMPRKVTAIGRSYLQKNIPDTTLSIFDFKGDKSSHIFVSWLNPFKEQKLSVIGDKAMAVFDGVKNELVVYPHRVKWGKDKIPEAIRAEGKKINFPEKEPLLEEAKEFLKSIKERKNPITDGKEGLHVLKILEICQKSLNQNGKPLNL
jgi:UDP-2-acetamido-3-amino-2,3-dideoxy-glucuronate N-acetyltransferase